MEGRSYLDKKYFINANFFNCPFCYRNNLPYELTHKLEFDWNNDKKCFIFLAKCSYCDKMSIYLSCEDFTHPILKFPEGPSACYRFDGVEEIDSKIAFRRECLLEPEDFPTIGQVNE